MTEPQNDLQKAFQAARENPGKMVILSSNGREGTEIKVTEGPAPHKSETAKEYFGSENAYEFTL